MNRVLRKYNWIEGNIQKKLQVLLFQIFYVFLFLRYEQNFKNRINLFYSL